MTAEPEGNGAEQSRDNAGQAKCEHESEPRRGAMNRRQPGRCIGANADKGGLAERRQSTDASQQHDAKRDQRVDADVVEERDGEFGGPQRSRGECSYCNGGEDDARAHDHRSTSASSSST